jgi:ABC-2 type transport system permease protein
MKDSIQEDAGEAGSVRPLHRTPRIDVGIRIRDLLKKGDKMTATSTPPLRIITSRALGFAATLNSEWTKLRTVRSTWIMAGLAIGLSIGFSAAVALATGLTFDSWGAVEQATWDPGPYSLSGLLFSLTLLIVLGVTAVTSEYSSGMIGTTFMITPQRARVFAAKAILVGALGLLIHAIAAPGMFLVSQLIYGSYGLDTASITDSDATRFLLVVVLVVPLSYTLISFSIACLLRGTASAITASIGFIFLPSMLAPLLPAWVQQNVLRFLPDMANDSLSGFTPPGSLTYLSQTPAIIVVVIWLAGSLALSAFVLNRRDV